MFDSPYNNNKKETAKEIEKWKGHYCLDDDMKTR